MSSRYYKSVAPKTKEKEEKLRALHSQKKTMDAITGFFDKATFGLSTPKPKKKTKK